jgi:Mrp family chromosome partitioning ATPase
MFGRGKATTSVAAAVPDEAETFASSLARFSAENGAIITIDSQRERLVSDMDEVFRGIYTRSGIGYETLAICSAIAGEGRTTLSLGLGLSLAQDFPQRQVLVVETDMQRPALASDFNMEPAPGLLDCLESGEPLHVAYRETFLPNFQVVPIGTPVANPSRLLRSSRMAAALEMARQTHDTVILDLPGLLVNSDSVLLAELADALLLVVRAGATPATLVSRALEEIDQSKLRGIVLNGSQSAIPGWLRRLCGI